MDFSTLYDYDYDDYLYQEKVKKQDFPDYKSVEYFAYQHPSQVIDSWAILLCKFPVTCKLPSLMKLTAGDDYINQLILMTNGENQGKQEKGGFLWDMKIDAGGLEAQLDELQSRWYIYQRERWYALVKRLTCRLLCIYRTKIGTDDPQRFLSLASYLLDEIESAGDASINLFLMITMGKIKVSRKKVAFFGI